MGVQPELSAAESRRTLLLYCPYDRKVTRHARRGPATELTCLECGRKLDAMPQAESARQPLGLYTQRTAPLNPIGGAVRSRRFVTRRPQRWRGTWLPLGLVTLALVIGGLAAINVVLKLASPPAVSEAAHVDAVAEVGPPETLRIANTDGVGAYIRRTPNIEDRLRAWSDGTRLTVVGAGTSVEGVEWKHVQDPAGNRGWIPAQYTAPEARR
jgi:hypothetical protein